MTSAQIQISRPDDLHLHVRDGEAMRSVVQDSARQFARAIIMPNLQQPIVNTVLAEGYRQRILQALPDNSSFEPLMTLYLTDDTSVAEIKKAKASGMIHGLKLYPAGATTNSSSGVTDINKIYHALQEMEACGLPLLVHGEVTDQAIDIFDRERVFIETILEPLIKQFPDLKIILEHITTKDAIDFVNAGADHLAATITVHHLLMNRNEIFNGGIRPHHYCLPVLKREEHRKALLAAATSGSKKFFLGTDSAPHSQQAKESACGCAGMYTAYSAIEMYAEVFDAEDSLDKLEGFSSHYGADFYGLSRNTEMISLSKTSWEIPESLPMGNDRLIPLRAGGRCLWKLI